MGLDITAYRRIQKMDVVFDASGEPIDPVTRTAIEYDFQAWVSPDFPGRADDIEDRGVYEAADSFRLRAGSYSGYNGWRESLARLAGYPAVEVDRFNTGSAQMRHDGGTFEADGGPFWELINFSDCDGIIGASVSAKLAADFAEFQGSADAHEDEWFRSQYAKWREAFEMAADGGAVQFH